MYLFIAGSTGTGKTDLARALKNVLLPKTVKLISCDSVQIYKQLTIGSNKDTNDHFGTNLVYLSDSYDVDRYVDYVQSLLETGCDLVIIVGGTLFYMQRLIDTLSCTNDVVGLIWLERDRIQLYRSTDLRCEAMVLSGLLFECSFLYETLISLKTNVSKSIRYRSGKEFITFIRNKFLSNKIYYKYLTVDLRDKFKKYKMFFETTKFVDILEFEKIKKTNSSSINLFKDVDDENLKILILEFEKFLKDFQKRTRNYVRKQNSFFNTFYSNYAEKIPICVLNADPLSEEVSESQEKPIERLVNEAFNFIYSPSTNKHLTKNNFKALKIYNPHTVLLNGNVLEELLSELILFQFFYHKFLKNFKKELHVGKNKI